MKEIVPETHEGKKVDLHREATCESVEDAKELFRLATVRLLDPTNWKSLTGKASADFEPKKFNHDKQATVKEGDFIQIDIPAPGLSAGHGHDWVRVDKIEKDVDATVDESVGLTVMVSPPPGKSNEEVAHFFAAGASSSFIIKRDAEKVMASYHGRNEKPNLENHGVIDKIRNAVVATGALLGMSELQWKALLEGFLKPGSSDEAEKQ
jgi:hypothetical protein